ncbi:nucleotide exchange factor GrpE [Pasteurella bettyae]|uniref:Protein GrpE n=1 Tax=Pasteurella bettyae CCUG 2042 TaxID=1095749 RepID=I3D7T4_9PAST|nr:nucleotide exchange factor GrpE [Pasteurella bettyae]EIJ67777.1 co-chaperone GrpE [Pasteurella bettyae CCUG 2042]SUB22095.1 nucleotide exchange factor GrpE [Pasteurella bettyae]
MSEQAQNQEKVEITEDLTTQEIQDTEEQTTVEEEPSDALEEAIARVQELEEQLAETAKKEQDLLLRSRAEMDNMRRRAEQDVEKAHKFALEKFSKDILNTIDNLERALASPVNKEDESIKALFDGVELTLKELLATVGRFGVEPVGNVGEAFNPEMHQAISMQPAEGFESNQITSVLQKGYLLNGRVIRPAMVMVAS